MSAQNGLPHDTRAERAVLAACFGSEDGSVVLTALRLLRPEHFYHDLHQRIFSAIASLSAEGRLSDPTTVRDLLLRRGGPTADITPEQLQLIVDSYPTSANVEFYAIIVCRHALARRAYASHQDSIGRILSYRYTTEDLGIGSLLAPPPTPLEPLSARSPFPLHALPPVMRDFVCGVSRATQTPPDLAANLALAVLSTAASGRLAVCPRPGWVEPAHIWVLVVLPSGDRKSAVLRLVVAPLQDAERTLIGEHKTAVVEARVRKEVAKARAAREQDAASAEGADEDTVEEAVARACEAEEIAIPPPPRILLQDATPEAIATFLAMQDGRIALFCPEATPIVLLARYTRDGKPHVETFLLAHSGDTLRVDRLNRGSEIVDCPALTMGLTAQPQFFATMARAPDLSDRGFFARFLISIPASLVGHREIGPAGVAQPVIQAYGELVSRMLAALRPLESPRILSLSPVAERRLAEFERWLEPRLEPEAGEFAQLGGWASKLAGAVLRLAGLLHAAENPGPDHTTTISIETLQSAICLGEYYLDHAHTAFALLGSDPAIADAKLILNWILSRRIEKFTAREAFNATRGRVQRMERLRAALRVLEEHRHIEVLPDLPPLGPGRPRSPLYLVRATGAQEHAQNPQKPPPPSGLANSADSAHGIDRKAPCDRPDNGDDKPPPSLPEMVAESPPCQKGRASWARIHRARRRTEGATWCA